MNTRNSPAKSFAIDLQVERVSRYRGILRTVPKAFGAQWTSRGRWFTRTYRNVSEGGLKRERLGRGCKLNCVNGHRKNDTKETRWPSTSTSSTNCWRTTRSPKTSLAKMVF